LNLFFLLGDFVYFFIIFKESMSNAPTPNELLDDTFYFQEDETVIALKSHSQGNLKLTDSLNPVWKILIVDDERAVHRATELALRNFTFEGKPLQFVSAYSGKEGKRLIANEHKDAAIVLLDVVMETHDAGLKVAQYIREILNNRWVRIVLRTGQPGEAPEESVILDYDINDYKLKVELTRQRLITMVIASLRSYRDILTIEQQKLELNQALAALQQAKEQLTTYSQNLEVEVSKRTAALKQANQELHRLAMLDGLTRVANRRHFDEYLQQQWTLLTRLQQPLSLILVDVDEFKLYNDHYGHLAGDDCLKHMAQAISDAIMRPTDLVTRYGGEEFAIVLPFTTLDGAKQVAKTVKSAVYNLKLPHAKSSVSDRLTLSLGISCMVPQPEVSLKTLISTADVALYQAKGKGRNCICHCEPSPTSIDR
jgi:diguanylate cyclase (GGDEF)-like protein